MDRGAIHDVVDQLEGDEAVADIVNNLWRKLHQIAEVISGSSFQHCHPLGDRLET